MLCEVSATQVVEWRSRCERWLLSRSRRGVLLLSSADSDWVCCFDEAWLRSVVAIGEGRRGNVN